MNSLQRFFQIPSVKFTVHLLLVGGFLANIYNIYNLYRIQAQANAESLVFQKLIQENNESKNEKDYYNSALYQEKYAKEINYKKKGEEVLDTSLLETVDNQNPNYIPEKKKQEFNNIQRWQMCFFGSTIKQENVQVNSQFGFEPLCKV